MQCIAFPVASTPHPSLNNFRFLINLRDAPYFDFTGHVLSPNML